MSKTLKDRVLKTIIESKQVTKKEIEDAKLLQKRKKITLDEALIEKGLIKEQDLLALLVKELNIPFINLSKYKVDPALKEMVPEKVARQYGIIPLSSLDYTITIALSDPLNIFKIDDIKNITGKDVDVVMSTKSDIKTAIENYYGSDSLADVKELSKDIKADEFEIISATESEDDVDAALDESEKAPIIRMVNLIIKEAINKRASDIHIEPMVDVVRIRYRIDGVLHDILEIPKKNQNAIIVRIKIMAQLDITANQVPQDGRFKLKMGSSEVDFRVSILPTTFGQKVVLRVLDKGNLSVGIGGLGLSQKAFGVLSEAIVKPFGMLLVTGPTGSGKSTTLYSIINELNTVDKNIITIEDPVEYLIEGLTQIHARPEIGLTFAEGLKSVLRQSPDIVMVGEIRDGETADIAIKAALTGQLVLSTLHTNDTAGALTRLIDMGVEPFLVASSIILVTAQRLCRKICENCKEEVDIEKTIKDQINYPFKPNMVFHHGKGCDTCHQTGYFGRLSISEVMDVDDKIREMLLGDSSADQIKKYAIEENQMDTLWEDAMAKCLSGLTTLEEVLRVTTAEG